MPPLIRKCRVVAAEDGLVLQSLSSPGQTVAHCLSISYGNAQLGPGSLARAEGSSFVAFGVAGLMTVVTQSFLITITRRQRVAIIDGHAVYVVTEVALTPLGSREAAEAAVRETATSLNEGVVDGFQRAQSTNAVLAQDAHEEQDTEQESIDVQSQRNVDDVEPDPEDVGAGAAGGITSTVARDVIARKGSYGRFAQKWFSQNGWAAGQKRSLGLSGSDSLSIASNLKQIPTSKQSTAKATNLLPKLLRTTKILLGTSRSFYFSYDHDLTRRLSHEHGGGELQPDRQHVDPLYFWNRHLLQSFITQGRDSWALPLIQGFVGQATFVMDADPPAPISKEEARLSVELSDFSRSRSPSPRPTRLDQYENTASRFSKSTSQRVFALSLISRRVVKRAGLRYLRRGIDEEGYTANEVETEQILSCKDGSTRRQSFVQLRGSIPVFWTQQPYSFKPAPVLQHPDHLNLKACTLHFERLRHNYNHVQVASLVEKSGNEAIVGEAYKSFIDRYNEDHPDEEIGFEWFDFHHACRGMHFENVHQLLDLLEPVLDKHGQTVVDGGKVRSAQEGVVRTNCMDCLDRSNVVQSACARRALGTQLQLEGIDMTAQVDQETTWFNNLWADNGDAISKQYASTAALKGDFTRTSKRNYKGAITDIGLSISRYYSGIVNDFFSQSAIDFLLGNVSDLVFDDFEANMMSKDPAISMARIRQQAIDESQKIAIANEEEEFLGGWSMLTPQASNTIKSTPFEEVVLLVTNTAIYACRFDWNTDKVASFERIDHCHIIGIQWGIFITSILSPAQRDEERNLGLVITYTVGNDEDICRVNTRSMSSVAMEDGSSKGRPITSALRPSTRTKPTSAETRILSLKALPARSASQRDEFDGSAVNELDQVKSLCAEIDRLAIAAKKQQHAEVHESAAVAGDRPEVRGHTSVDTLVKHADIITLAEAKKSTGLIEQLGHSLKKLVWA